MGPKYQHIFDSLIYGEKIRIPLLLRESKCGMGTSTFNVF